MGLARQEVVDELAAVAAARQAEMQDAVEAARPQQRRVERVGPVRGPDEEDVGERRRRRLEVTVGRQVPVGEPDEPVAGLVEAGRLVEALHLDEELVDDAADALRHTGVVDGDRATTTGRRRRGRRGHPAALDADGVDLLDEADGAALPPCHLAQLAEEGADLAGSSPVPHRLERRRGDEEERDAGLFRHRLGRMGLAGSGGAFEEDAATRIAAHLGPESTVVEEHTEGVAYLGDDPAETLHVIEADLELFWQVDGVRGAAVSEHRHDEDGTQEEDEEDAGEPEHRLGRQVGEPGRDRVSGGDPPPHPGRDRGEDDGEATQPPPPVPLSCNCDVDRHGSGSFPRSALVPR